MMALSATLARLHITDDQRPGLLQFGGRGVDDFPPLRLQTLAGTLNESWVAEDSVLEHQDMRSTQEFAAVCAEASFGSAAELEENTEKLYTQLLARLRHAGYPHLLRQWNYFPRITEGSGDGEYYRHFCVGRGRAFDAHGLGTAALCAATAIGSPVGPLQIFLLAGKAPGLPVSNPRQTEPFEYPRSYGPRPPSFARATIAGGLLMISGTAAVVGHESFPADTAGQLETTLENLEALVAEAAELASVDTLGGEGCRLRCYLKNGKDLGMVRKRLTNRFPDTKIVYLQGEICRPELLVEIEAVQRLQA